MQRNKLFSRKRPFNLKQFKWQILALALPVGSVTRHFQWWLKFCIQLKLTINVSSLIRKLYVDINSKKLKYYRSYPNASGINYAHCLKLGCPVAHDVIIQHKLIFFSPPRVSPTSRRISMYFFFLNKTTQHTRNSTLGLVLGENSNRALFVI